MSTNIFYRLRLYLVHKKMAPTIFPLARLVADKRARPNTRRRPTKHNNTKGGHHKKVWHKKKFFCQFFWQDNKKKIYKNFLIYYFIFFFVKMVSDISHDVRVLSGHASLLFHIFLGEKRERIFCLFFTIGKIECRHLSKKKRRKRHIFVRRRKKKSFRHQ